MWSGYVTKRFYFFWEHSSNGVVAPPYETKISSSTLGPTTIDVEILDINRKGIGPMANKIFHAKTHEWLRKL